MISRLPISKLRHALPFMVGFSLIPILWFAALKGGWWLILPPLAAWHSFTLIDALMGLNLRNEDTKTPEDALFWYRLHVALWVPAQAISLFGLIYLATHSEHLSRGETIMLFFDAGILTGTVGIVYAHELMHQKPAWERWLGDILMSMALYGHFRSEHLLVHHRYVATPKDAVSARYNEGFHRFFARVIHSCMRSAWDAEVANLRRKRKPWHDRANPFWIYAALGLLMLTCAFIIGGWLGVALFTWQAFIAIWQLELTNYVEHYGLTREHLGDGKYEFVKPRHSWNAAHTGTNWLLINLQRHSDHHYKPTRRFPLLQNYSEDDAPQLPYGYPLMTMAALVPPVWRRMMNPRVRAWRKQHYPHITDWQPYKNATLPLPK